MPVAKRRCCGAPRWTISPRGAWSRRTACGWKWSASATTSARSTTPPPRLSASAVSKRTARLHTAKRRYWIFPAMHSARPGWARMSPTNSSPACPASRKKAATASSPRRASSCTAPMNTPAPCAWSSSARCMRRCPRSSKLLLCSMHAATTLLPSPVFLAGLEHLDERYLKAVDYATKARRGTRPKMVLIADVVGDDANAVASAASEIVRLANLRSGEGFIAVSAEARKKFWLDRARTAAIARHTNAFKVNEDVVIPLRHMGDYCDGIERINIELSLKNKLKLLDALDEFFAGELPLHYQDDAQLGDAELLDNRPQLAQQMLAEVRTRWQWLLDNLDAPLGEEIIAPEDRLDAATVFAAVQRRLLRAWGRGGVGEPLRQIFSGGTYQPILDQCNAIHQGVLKSRVFVALHMHAGDGNVHSNIPVNSDDYEMLQQAYAAVDRIMRLAKELGGVISGEHGIGITKFDYLEPQEGAAFAAYKQRIDPEGRFNKGKLLRGSNLERAYTPSFNLMELESLILEKSELGEIADSFKDCLRCGKCKPVCNTHVPRANLLY